MKKTEALSYIYEIATLQVPNDTVLELFESIEFDRCLELLMILRRSNKVKSPANFLRRAIEEGWTAESQPKPINRKLQRIAERSYRKRGLSEAEIKARALEDAKEY